MVKWNTDIWIDMEMIHLKNSNNRLIITILMFLACGLTYSQSIIVASCTLAEDDNNAIAVDTQVLDQNGERCALLKIQTTETGFTFDVGSLGIIKTVEQPNEIWLYVPYGIKKISISHPKYENLKDYHFPVNIRSGHTYIMDLDLRRTYAPGTGAIDVISDVAGAEVYLDGRKIGNTPLKMGEISKGKHSLILRKSGYSLFSRDIVVEENNELELNVKLPLSQERMISSQLKSAVHDCTRTYKFVDRKAVIQKNGTEAIKSVGPTYGSTLIYEQLKAMIDLNGNIVDDFIKDFNVRDYYDHKSEHTDDSDYRTKYDSNLRCYVIVDRNDYVVKLLSEEFVSLSPFCDGLAVVALVGYKFKYGYIDLTGKLVISAIYDEARDFSNGLASVRKGQKYGYINRQGKIVIDCLYDSANDFVENLALVQIDGKYGYINRQGKIVIDCIYDSANDFIENLALVQIDGKYGYINKQGEIEIDCIYDNAHDFSEGFAFVKMHGKWGFIDQSDKLLTPFIYNSCEDSNFHEGMAVVHIGDKWGYVNKYGNDTF